MGEARQRRRALQAADVDGEKQRRKEDERGEELRPAKAVAQRPPRERDDGRGHTSSGSARVRGSASAAPSRCTPVLARNTSSSVGCLSSSSATARPASSSARRIGAMSAAPCSRPIDRWQASVAGRSSPKRATTSRATLQVARAGEHEVEVRPADLGLQRGGRVGGDDPPAGDDPEPVGELVGLLEVLRREEDGRAFVAQPADLVPQRQARGRVKAGRRLVEEQHLGLVDERHREVQAPAHAAGVRADAAIGGLAEADALDELGAAGAHGRAARCRAASPAARSARCRS